MTSTDIKTTAGRDLSDRRFLQLIGGKLVAGASTQPVVDPGTGSAFAIAPVADTAQVDAAVDAARVAFPAWSALPLEDRAQVLSRFGDAIEARRQEIAEVVVLENGKPLGDALGDVDGAVAWVRHFAALRPVPEVLKDDPESYIEARRRPIGVVAAIIPWNFPFFQTVYKLAPALLAGDTVVVKPSPTTPLNACLLAELLVDVVPPGVVNIVGDGGDVGPYLVGHDAVGKVSFTGSTAAGRKVMASGAETLKRIVLELGGNDAAIVMPDAAIDAVVKPIFSWAFMNAGQVCINIKRIYVHRSKYDEFSQRFAELADAAVVGHGLNTDTEIGPIQNARQLETVKGYLDLAHRDGTVIAGGTVVDGAGYFVRPTVIRDIDEDSLLVREETFGPIRTILPYDDVDDAVARANDTPYGLGNSVWGEDVQLATDVARRLESGTVWVNTHFALLPNVPFGGSKQSGLGVEFGREGYEEFTDSHVVHVARS